MHIGFTAHNAMMGFSSAGVLAYLEKENEERNSIFFESKNEDLEFELNQEYLQNQNKFFSNSEDKFYTHSEATNEIDGNISNRHKQKESAFFMLNVFPSKQELEHLKGLFLNADSGFDSENLRQKLEMEEIIGNIKTNPRNRDQ